jgi:hypothetical protein
VASKAAPSVVGRVRDHPGTQRIEFDVALTGKQISLRLHERRPKAAIPKRAYSTVLSIDVPNVAASHRNHRAREIVFSNWRHQEMHVIRHQHVSVQRDLCAPQNLAQQGEVADVILFGEEARAPVMSALNHVNRNAGI